MESMSFEEVLQDLCSRLVINAPRRDRESVERLMHLVQSAHWFYQDEYVKRNQSLKSLNFEDFTYSLFNKCDPLKHLVPRIDEIFTAFRSYNRQIPFIGAIILDETYERCLLVRDWEGRDWAFPGGKRQKAEADKDTAIREVLEETGFNVSQLINMNDCIQYQNGERRIRLFIVGGVNHDTKFTPQTQQEISEISWQLLDDIQRKSQGERLCRLNGLRLISPTLESLSLWISRHQPPVTPNPDAPVKALTVWKKKGQTERW